MEHSGLISHSDIDVLLLSTLHHRWRCLQLQCATATASAAARSQTSRCAGGHLAAGAVETSKSALHFATTAKRVQMKPVVNEVKNDKTVIARMQLEIQELREQLVRRAGRLLLIHEPA